jgi:hypothetical protein
MYLRPFPFDFMPSAEANPSGKSEIKIDTVNTVFTAPPVTRDIPRAMFYGMLSIIEPTSKDNPKLFAPNLPFHHGTFFFLCCHLLIFYSECSLPLYRTTSGAKAYYNRWNGLSHAKGLLYR